MASDLPVIAGALRTPIGEVHGALSQCHPAELLASVLAALGERSAIEPKHIEQVIVGCAMPVGAQSDIGRAALLAAGWPDTIPAGWWRSPRTNSSRSVRLPVPPFRFSTMPHCAGTAWP